MGIPAQSDAGALARRLVVTGVGPGLLGVATVPQGAPAPGRNGVTWRPFAWPRPHTTHLYCYAALWLKGPGDP